MHSFPTIRNFPRGKWPPNGMRRRETVWAERDSRCETGVKVLACPLKLPCQKRRKQRKARGQALFFRKMGSRGLSLWCTKVPCARIYGAPWALKWVTLCPAKTFLLLNPSFYFLGIQWTSKGDEQIHFPQKKTSFNCPMSTCLTGNGLHPISLGRDESTWLRYLSTEETRGWKREREH